MSRGEKNGNYGKRWTQEMKKSLSEKKKGLRAYNNSEICVMAHECPEGFVLGMLKKELTNE